MQISTYATSSIKVEGSDVIKFNKIMHEYTQAFHLLFSVFKDSGQESLFDSKNDAAIIATVSKCYPNIGQCNAKYPDIVRGALLKVRSIFLEARSKWAMPLYAPYWAFEYNASAISSFCLPAVTNGNSYDLAHVGKIPKTAKEKCTFVEFVRSSVDSSMWIVKEHYTKEIKSEKGCALLAVNRADLSVPLVTYDASAKPSVPNVQKLSAAFNVFSREYANIGRIKHKRKSTNLAEGMDDLRRVNYYKFQTELAAYESAASLATDLYSKASQVGVVMPVTASSFTAWDNLFMNVVVNELYRVGAKIAIANKQPDIPFHKFHDMAYCPHCGHGLSSNVRSEMVCCKDGHDSVNIYVAAIANAHNILMTKFS